MTEKNLKVFKKNVMITLIDGTTVEHWSLPGACKKIFQVGIDKIFCFIQQSVQILRLFL